ncbi:MAG: hypothetical protein PHE15_00770 [Dehalococcoidales bacterium]|nr:hypothetical protein [Dehalococcoidales bacterium]
MKKKLFRILLVFTLVITGIIGASWIGVIAQENNLTYYEGISFPGQNINTEVSDIQITDIKCIQMNDQEFKEKVAELWGDEAAAKAVRVDKDIDLNTGEPLYVLNPTSVTAQNWCGYWLQNNNIYGVIGWFNARQCTGTDARDATWIGIGGASANNLLQTGIDMSLMEAWVEALPGGPQYLFSVDQNDEIHASIGYSFDRPGYWYVSILDQTTWDGWGGYISYNPERYACWIIETPYKNPWHTSQYHIGSFGTVSLDNCAWWGDELEYHDINWDGEGGTLYKITEHTLNNEWLSASAIGADGESFSIIKN